MQEINANANVLITAILFGGAPKDYHFLHVEKKLLEDGRHIISTVTALAFFQTAKYFASLAIKKRLHTVGSFYNI